MRFKYIFFAFLILAIILGAHSAHAGIIFNHPNYWELANGLVGYWSFEPKDIAGTDPATFYDRSGNSNDATSTGDALPVRILGKIGQALSFNGVNQYIQAPDSTSLSVNSISISFWVKLNGAPAGRFLSKWSGGVNQRSYFIDNAGGLETSKDGTSNSGCNAVLLTVLKIGTWYHIVDTYDNASQALGAYVNGVYDLDTANSTGNGTCPANWQIFDGTSNLAIGAADTGQANGFANVTIDDVRIYNRALSPAEAKRLYNLGAAMHTNSSSLGKNGTLQNGLVGWWTFDGKDVAGIPSGATPGTAYDGSGQGNNGLYYNATGTLPVAGKLGQALQFDGTSSFIDLGTPSALDITGNISVSAWVKLFSFANSGYSVIFEKGFDGINEQYVLREQGPDTFSWLTYNGSTHGVVYVLAGGVQLNTWYHAVGTFDGSRWTLYLNGAPVLSSDDTQGPIHTANRVYIGAADINNHLDRFFNGLIDDVRVYNRALSSDEITRLYRIGATLHTNSNSLGKNGTLQNGLVGYWSFDQKDVSGFPVTKSVPIIFDRSGNGNNAVLLNASSSSPVPGKIGQAFLFDGVDDSAKVYPLPPSLTNLTQITIAAWFKVLDHKGSSAVSINGCGGSFGGWYFGPNASRTIDWYVCGNGVGGDGEWDTSSTISTNVWVHLAVTYDRTNFAQAIPTFYINGVAQSGFSFQQQPVAPAPDDSTLAFTLGRCLPNCGGSNEIMDEVRVYNRVLSADEVRRLYNMGR